MVPSLLRRSRTKTDMWSVFVVVICSVLYTAGHVHAQAPPGPDLATPTLRLDELAATKRFCATGPEAAIARGKALLAASLVAAAEVLPNPTLSTAHERNLTGADEHETVIGIEIPLGIGGRRWLLQDAAAARQAQSQLEASHGRVISALSFRRTFVQATLAHARLTLMQKKQQTYSALVHKLDQLQRGGDHAQLDRDRLRVEAELGAANMAKQQRELSAHQIWIELIVNAPVELSNDLSQLAGRATARKANQQKTHLQVAALQKAARAHAIEADAARRRWVPDLDLFAGYRTVGGKQVETGHGIALGLSLPLTFFDRGQAQAQRAEAQASIATAKIEKVKRNSIAASQAAQSQLAAVAQAVPRVKKAIELAKKTELGTERLYLAGEATLLDILQSTQGRTELEFALIDLVEAEAKALLTLAQARGRFAEKELNTACIGGAP